MVCPLVVCICAPQERVVIGVRSGGAVYTTLEGDGRVASVGDLDAVPSWCRGYRHSIRCLPLADMKRVIFAGHSMGGHGTLVAAISHSDR